MGKKLVAYFSATGTTERVAQRLAEATGSDIFEIAPKVAYTSEDLNWMDKKSRSSREMDDRNSRPEMRELCENIDDYDVIYLGFPIWWYREPSIIDTFLESADFTGKTIMAFATSGSSGMGRTETRLKSLAKGADVRNSRRFASGVSATELRKWAE